MEEKDYDVFNDYEVGKPLGETLGDHQEENKKSEMLIVAKEISDVNQVRDKEPYEIPYIDIKLLDEDGVGKGQEDWQEKQEEEASKKQEEEQGSKDKEDEFKEQKQQKDEKIKTGRERRKSLSIEESVVKEEIDKAVREKDTSFGEYKRQSEMKPRSRFVRLGLGMIKLCVFIMLLPLLLIIAGFIGGGSAAMLGGGIFLIGGGIALLAGTAFFVSKLSTAFIALGLCLAVTLAAVGGLVLIIGSICCKKGIKIIKKYSTRRARHAAWKEEK